MNGILGPYYVIASEQVEHSLALVSDEEWTTTGTANELTAPQHKYPTRTGKSLLIDD